MLLQLDCDGCQKMCLLSKSPTIPYYLYSSREPLFFKAHHFCMERNIVSSYVWGDERQTIASCALCATHRTQAFSNSIKVNGNRWCKYTYTHTVFHFFCGGGCIKLIVLFLIAGWAKKTSSCPIQQHIITQSESSFPFSRIWIL